MDSTGPFGVTSAPLSWTWPTYNCTAKEYTTLDSPAPYPDRLHFTSLQEHSDHMTHCIRRQRVMYNKVTTVFLKIESTPLRGLRSPNDSYQKFQKKENTLSHIFYAKTSSVAICNITSHTRTALNGDHTRYLLVPGTPVVLPTIYGTRSAETRHYRTQLGVGFLWEHVQFSSFITRTLQYGADYQALCYW